MYRFKRGTSIISLALCAVAITLVTTALVIATNNSAMYRAQRVLEKQAKVIETSAYTKIYKLSEVKNIARQAFANNYLSFYDSEVDLEGFEALVLGEMMQQIPLNQLENYIVDVSHDGVDVQYKQMYE